jgi:hypothetical protein
VSIIINSLYDQGVFLEANLYALTQTYLPAEAVLKDLVGILKENPHSWAKVEMLLINELLAQPILMLLVQLGEAMQVLRGQGQFLLLVVSGKDKENDLFTIDWRFHWGLPLSWEESECPFVLLLLFDWYFYALLL